MASRRFTLALLFCIGLGGCSFANSEHPLSAPEKSLPDDGLTGIWMQKIQSHTACCIFMSAGLTRTTQKKSRPRFPPVLFAS